jgi:YbbR domain-containing protein
MRNLKRHWMHVRILGMFIFILFSGCTSEPVETDLLIPVDYSNIPRSMVLTNFHTEKIEIRIQADPKLMERLNTENTRYSVDLYTDLEFDPAGDTDSIGPGTYLIPVEEKRIPMDPAIKILSITPPYLSVRIEREIRKFFPVTVPYVGSPAQGYIVLNAATDPVNVLLVGPESAVLSLGELKTKPVDITNANEDFKKKIPLDLDNPSIIPLPDHIITVTVPVQQQFMSKTIEHIPVQIRNAGSLATIKPMEILIRVKGPFEKISNKDILNQIYAFIDLGDLKSGVYARHAYVNIPVDLIMTEAVPQVFTVKIE